MLNYFKSGTWNCSVCSKSSEEVEFLIHSNGKPRKQCKVCFYERRAPLSKETRKRQYQNRNVDKCLEHTRSWRKRNLEYDAFRAATYRARKLQQTPPWADLEKIKEIYLKCPEGYHVDHIVPLKGKFVAGLHVETNLQYLPAKENLAKRNLYA
jgi:hypothetical protein